MSRIGCSTTSTRRSSSRTPTSTSMSSLGIGRRLALFFMVEEEKTADILIRVVLLHGPPGTGKTSLCRALAQKLAVRLSSRYPHGKLIEINSHSLFSKWFSESGKLVQRLFSTVTEMVEDESGFVVVLIGEYEHQRVTVCGLTLLSTILIS